MPLSLDKLNEVIEQVLPIKVKPGGYTSITIGLSKRFFIFQMIKQLVKEIEDDPYLNFISFLKNYKILGKFINGTISDLYRDRNKSYFKNFFLDIELYELVKSDIEWVYSKNKNVRLTITKHGVIIYDLYGKNRFNMLLLTVHSGTWVPKKIENKLHLSKEERILEEDVDVHRVYGNLFLQKGGIWIDSKFSRFACDFNRPKEKAIYSDKSERWLEKVWKEPLTRKQKRWLLSVYDEFYFTLEKLIEAYKFNIIFDGHSMSDSPTRPDISFGTTFVPRFYIPIIKSMQKKLLKMGYPAVLFNAPYRGGHILQWLAKKFPDLFIFTMEVNKKLYMEATRKKTIEAKLEELSNNIAKILEIEEDEQPVKEKEEPYTVEKNAEEKKQ